MSTAKHRETLNIGPITLIPGKHQSRQPYCNSILIADAGVIIDPSSNRKLLSSLWNDGKIEIVCLSHWHDDHYRYLHLLEDPPVWMSEIDAVPLRDRGTFLNWYGLERPGAEILKKQTEEMMDQVLHFRPLVPQKLLQDGDRINLGAVTMEVIATPGHTPGHLSFFFHEPSVLFLGDYNLDTLGPWVGEARADLSACLASLERLKQVPADILIVSHHPEPIEAGKAENLWLQYLDAIWKREEEILDYLAEPRSLDDIVSQWFYFKKAKEPLYYFRFVEQIQIEKYLEHLIDQQAVIRIGDRYQRR